MNEDLYYDQDKDEIIDRKKHSPLLPFSFKIPNIENFIEGNASRGVVLLIALILGYIIYMGFNFVYYKVHTTLESNRLSSLYEQQQNISKSIKESSEALKCYKKQIQRIVDGIKVKRGHCNK